MACATELPKFSTTAFVCYCGAAYYAPVHMRSTSILIASNLVAAGPRFAPCCCHFCSSAPSKVRDGGTHCKRDGTNDACCFQLHPALSDSNKHRAETEQAAKCMYILRQSAHTPHILWRKCQSLSISLALPLSLVSLSIYLTIFLHKSLSLYVCIYVHFHMFVWQSWQK